MRTLRQTKKLIDMIGTIIFLLFSAYLIFGITQSVCSTKINLLFHKRKIIEVTHADGTLDYTVKVNGLMGLPFLYQTEVVDYGLGEYSLTGMSLGEAKSHVQKKESEYKEIIGKRITKRKVYEDN